MHLLPADVTCRSFNTRFENLVKHFSCFFYFIFGVHIFLDYLVNFVIVSLDLRNMIK